MQARSTPLLHGALLVLCVVVTPWGSAKAQGGPDGLGYSWDFMDPTAYDFLTLSGGGETSILSGDDEVVEIQLPWDFLFYGQSYSSVFVSDNGALSFSATQHISYTNTSLPNSAGDSADLLIYWDDLVHTPGSSTLHVSHQLPEDQFIISWETYPHLQGAGAASFQLHLQPGGDIEFLWADTVFSGADEDNGASATLGIQDHSGGTNNLTAAGFLQVSHDSSFVVDGTGIVFDNPCTDNDLDGHSPTDDPICPGDDCDDNDRGRYQGLAEICADGVDQDCDGFDLLTDMDLDGDPGLGCGGNDCDDNNPGLDSVTDADGDGAVSCDDCDDTEPSVFPGATELCDGLDNDCDGTGDDLADLDGDGSTSCGGDCDDADPASFPGNPELCDGLDNDCDGSVDTGVDADSDGHQSAACGGTDCDDTDSTVHPGAAEACDGEDADCDGLADLEDLDVGADGDGDGAVDDCGDCNPTDPTIHPGATEDCSDLVDQDCDGIIAQTDADSDGFTSEACGGDDCHDGDASIHPGSDSDGDGEGPCGSDCDDTDPAISSSAAEICDDSIDNDCDGSDLASDQDGDGGISLPCGGDDCNDDDSTVDAGAAEICDGVDSDCDGLDIDGDTDGHLAVDCGGTDCDDTDPAAFTGAPESCDGVDSDCDGNLDVFDLDIGATAGFSSSGSASPEASIDGSAPVTSSIVLSDNGVVDDLDITVDLTHSFVGDLTLSLISPAGQEVILSDRNGGAGQDYANTVFDDEAFQAIVSASAPFAGTFQPQQALSAFDGTATAGSWTLRVVDHWQPTDPGILHSWSIAMSRSQVDDSDLDGAVDTCGDCDPSDSSVHPGAPEICEDGVDQDCDTSDLAVDADSDGAMAVDCGGLDCDDNNLAVYGGYQEICNDGLDNDCDPSTTDDQDADGDGVPCDLDCDDADPLSWPGFFEICQDGLDNDCDPTTADLLDLDGDGVDCDLDCDDTNPGILPGATEQLCNGVEDDCDPSVDPDEADGDGDGHLCGSDCDDSNAATHPGALEIPCDGLDNDCDSEIDTDGGADNDNDNDGSTCDLDCDDADPDRSPGLPELCNDGVDNDCNPSTDDDQDADGDGSSCIDDCDDNDSDTYPGAPELCNDGVDQDCDGSIDELADDPYLLGDSDSLRFELCSFAFPFCGSDWSELFVQDNGRLTFGFDDRSAQESIPDFLAQHPQLAALWTDLDPSAVGSVEVTEVSGSSWSLSFVGVPQFGLTGTANNFDLTLWSDGSASLAFGHVDADDGLVGFSCNGSNIVEADLSELAGSVGTGTEDAIYEVFSDLGSPNDLQGSTLDFCLTAGDDLDLDGWTQLCGDCDDSDPATSPSADELCDGDDNDCNGIDDDVDLDDDGFVDQGCGGTDCDDLLSSVHPGATEQCNGIDDDCDEEAETGNEDADQDGHLVCGGDCDDSNDTVHPGAEELCDLDENGDELDNDCDGEANEGFVTDLDEDGFIDEACGGDDCADDRPNTSPSSLEICDSYDNDCNGIIDDLDDDGDGFVDDLCGGDDCDDTNPQTHPDATEIPYDGIDNDCSGGDLVDADEDGFTDLRITGGTDCDDEDPQVHPGLVEICDDGIDNDCDEFLDGDDEVCGACAGCETNLSGNSPDPRPLLLFLIVVGASRRRSR